MAAPVPLGTTVACSLHVIQQCHLHVGWQVVCIVCTMLFAFALAIAWIETVMDDIVKPCKSFCKCASIVKGHWICFQDLTLQVWFESSYEFVQDLVPAYAIQLLHAPLESVDITGHPTGLMQSVQFVTCSSFIICRSEILTHFVLQLWPCCFG